MRLSTEEKKEVEKIQSELLKEFERGNQNREEALYALNLRRRKADESAHTYAYQLMELVKLAYPTFADDTIKTIAKDYYVKGLHPKMQVALKALSTFETANINDLATETTRLQLARIDSFANKKASECLSVDNPTVINAIAEQVIEKMKLTSMGAPGGEYGGDVDSGNAAFAIERSTNQRTRNYRNFSNRPRGTRNSQPKRACRSCQSTDHLYRSCPTRFCQACGARGHDAWERSCPKYQ